MPASRSGICYSVRYKNNISSTRNFFNCWLLPDKSVQSQSPAEKVSQRRCIEVLATVIIKNYAKGEYEIYSAL